MKTLADLVAGADEEARIHWANECADAALNINRVMAGYRPLWEYR